MKRREIFYGFFSDLFSKQNCVFCEQQVGALSRKKLKDKTYICKECEKNCSAYIDVSKFDNGFISNHIEYMKKQNILYEKEVAPLDKSKKERFVSGWDGIIFVDSIGMFEVISPKYNKKNVKELFRYDQIQDFNYYNVENTSTGEGQKKYSESGIEIIFRCPIDENGWTNNQVNGGRLHPYVPKIRIPFEKNTDDANCGGLAKAHLNKLFGRASESLLGSIKEDFTGTGKERAQFKAGVDSVKALGNLAKAAIRKDAEGLDDAKNEMKNVATDMFNATFNFGARYTSIADEAEKRAWEE